jgi:hypothetical protein
MRGHNEHCAPCGALVDESEVLYSEDGTFLCRSCADLASLRTADAVYEAERYRSAQAIAVLPTGAFLTILLAGLLLKMRNPLPLAFSAFLLGSAALPMFVDVRLVRRHYDENQSGRRHAFPAWLTVVIAETVHRLRARR